MAIVSTGLDERGLKAEFFERFDGTKTHFQDLATRIESNKGEERYGFLGSVPPMRAWGTGRLARGMYKETYDVENERYEITMEVDRIELDDDQTGQIRVRVQEMAERAAQHKDSEIAALLMNGATAGYLSYDGVTFFNAAHSSGASGSQSNILTPSATDAVNPTTAEFRTALAAGISRLLSFLDDQGEPMNQAPTGLVCCVPTGMYITALEALNASIVASTSNVLEGAAQVLSFAKFTDASKFFLMKTDPAVRALIFQDRDPIEFRALEGDSESGFRREVYQYGVRARYKMTYGYWQRALSLDFTE